MKAHTSSRTCPTLLHNWRAYFDFDAKDHCCYCGLTINYKFPLCQLLPQYKTELNISITVSSIQSCMEIKNRKDGNQIWAGRDCPLSQIHLNQHPFPEWKFIPMNFIPILLMSRRHGVLRPQFDIDSADHITENMWTICNVRIIVWMICCLWQKILHSSFVLK